MIFGGHLGRNVARTKFWGKEKIGGAKKFWGGQSNVFRHKMHEILLKITFKRNYLGGKAKFWGALAPPAPIGYVPNLEGSLGGGTQCSLLAMRMCMRTQLSETALTHKFTAHRHIVEQTHCCTRVVAQRLQILVISRKVRTLGWSEKHFCLKSKTPAHQQRAIDLKTPSEPILGCCHHPSTSTSRSKVKRGQYFIKQT